MRKHYLVLLLLLTLAALPACRSGGPGIDFGVTLPGIGGVNLHTTPIAPVCDIATAATDAVGLTSPPAVKPTPPATGGPPQ